jgi:hypothetical protein
MSPSDWERLERYLEYCENLKRVRMTIVDDQLRRSREALAKAYDLLAQPVPHIWRPEPPKE